MNTLADHLTPAALARPARRGFRLAFGSLCLAVLASLGARGQTSGNYTVYDPPLPVAPSRLINLSVLARLPADGKLITGFTIAGLGTKPLVIRAAGPSLTTYGVTDAMLNPTLAVNSVPSGTGVSLTVAANDDWNGIVAGAPTASATNATAATFVSVGAFPFPTGSADAAVAWPITSTTGAGAGFTAVITPKTGTAGGAVLTEVYDAKPATDSTSAYLTNMSVRGQIDSDTGIIAGFVVNGLLPMRMLIRVVGPSLASFGVTGTISDPKLTLRSSTGSVWATNDNWAENGFTSAAQIYEAIREAGAFPLIEQNSKDAAAVVLLSPGAYTVQATGVDGARGEALIELYQLSGSSLASAANNDPVRHL